MAGPSQTHYEALGVTEDAERDVVKRAYQRLVLKHHPDKQADVTVEEEKIQKIVEAWKILGESSSRRTYDAILKEKRRVERGVITAEVDLDEMDEAADGESYSWPCRCGGSYVIEVEDLEGGVEMAGCTGCSLRIKVLYEEES